ncbi:MAG: hypothetical protein HQ568_02760, partial [Calditrichaeota bacterium]|nr:hypothetical protein [Calditrichota bacterium]
MRTTIFLFTIICIVLTARADLFAQNHENIEAISSFFHQWNGANCAEVEGDYAYIGTGYGLRILDISNFELPDQVTCVLNDYSIVDIQMIDTLVYISAQRSDREPDRPGFYIFNFADPTQPVQLGYLESVSARSLVIRNDEAFCISGSGLWIVDISNPENPREIISFETLGFPHDMDIVNDLAYIADGDSGLRIIDISDFENITEIGSFQTEFQAYCIEVVNSVAFLSDFHPNIGGSLSYSYGHLRIIDVSDPTEPEEIAILRNNLNYYVTVHEEIAYLMNEAESQVYDVSDPENPEHLADPGIGFQNLKFYEDYVTSCYGGFSILDFSDFENIDILSQYNVPRINDIACSGEYCFIATNSSLEIFNLTNMESPVRSAFINKSVYEIEILGDIAFIAGEGDFCIYDISNPIEPELIGILEDVGDFREFTVVDNLVYCAVWYAQQFIIIDIENPANPEIVGSTEVAWPQDVAVAGDYAYVGSNYHGLDILNISDPGNITLVERIEPNYSPQVEIIDNLLLLRARRLLIIMDISDPVNPTIISETPYGSFYGFYVDGDLIYLLSEGIQILNISDPVTPVPVGFYQVEDYTGLIRHYDDIIYCYHHDAINLYEFTGGGFLHVSPNNLDFSFVTVGYSPEQSLDLLNSGNAPLIVNDVWSSHEQFRYEFNHAVELDPGGSFELPVSFLSLEDGYFSAVLNIGTDHEGGFDRLVDLKAHSIRGVHMETAQWASDLLLTHGYLLVSDEAVGILTVDISEPRMPEIVHAQNDQFYPKSMCVEGDLLYAAGRQRLDEGGYSYHILCLDINDPLNPGLLSNIERDHNISGIEAKNGFLYVAETSNPLVVYNYNQPRSPRSVATIERDWWVYNIKISDDLLFVNDRDHGQFIFDISNPPDCEQIGFIPCTCISEIEFIVDFVYVI